MTLEEDVVDIGAEVAAGLLQRKLRDDGRDLPAEQTFEQVRQEADEEGVDAPLELVLGELLELHQPLEHLLQVA